MSVVDFEKFPLIHEIQVTDENIVHFMSKEIIRLLMSYGPGVKEKMFAIALGPNAYKCFQEWGRSRQMIYDPKSPGGMWFEGVRVVCGPLPFVVPLWNEDGWYYAHEDAKRLTQALQVGDA